MRSLRPTAIALAILLSLTACGGATEEPASPDGDAAAAEDTTAPVDTTGPRTSAASAADTVPVEPVDLPDASGTLVARVESDTIRLTLTMSGLEDGTRYLPNVHEGRCGGSMGPAVGSLQPFTGAGREAVTTTGAIPASELAAGGEYFVEVHGLGTAACANLPVPS